MYPLQSRSFLSLTRRNNGPEIMYFSFPHFTFYLQDLTPINNVFSVAGFRILRTYSTLNVILELD